MGAGWALAISAKAPKTKAGGCMAKKSILEQIESGERVRLILVAPDQRDAPSGLRRTGDC